MGRVEGGQRRGEEEKEEEEEVSICGGWVDGKGDGGVTYEETEEGGTVDGARARCKQ